MIAPLGLVPLGSPFGDDGVSVVKIPSNLAAAIVARFATAPTEGIRAIYKDEAVETAEMPYLVFTIDRGRTLRTDSTAHWYDRRVRFTVYSHDADEANVASGLVWESFRGRLYDYERGFSIEFDKNDHFEGKDKGRGSKNRPVYRSGFEVSARVCEFV